MTAAAVAMVIRGVKVGSIFRNFDASRAHSCPIATRTWEA